MNTIRQQDDPVLSVCEQALDKLKRTEIERDSFKVQLDLERQRIINLQEHNTNLKEISAEWKEAAQKGKSVIAVDERINQNDRAIIARLEEQHRADLAEIRRLEIENEKLRNSRNWRTLFGGLAGAGICAAVK